MKLYNHRTVSEAIVKNEYISFSVRDNLGRECGYQISIREINSEVIDPPFGTYQILPFSNEKYFVCHTQMMRNKQSYGGSSAPLYALTMRGIEEQLDQRIRESRQRLQRKFEGLI